MIVYSDKSHINDEITSNLTSLKTTLDTSTSKSNRKNKSLISKRNKQYLKSLGFKTI